VRTPGPRIVLLGAGGLLGSDCVSALAGLGELIPLAHGDLELTDQARVRSLLQELRPATVVNCAGYTDVDGCEARVDWAHSVNALGPGCLAQLTRELGAHILHISTDYVFDGNRPLPHGYTEEDPASPRNVYGKSKWEGEELVRRANPDHLILRTGWLYGRHGRCFPRAILAQALKGSALKVVADQFGSPTWSWTLAVQIRTLLEAGVRGTVHATAHGHCNWFEFALRFLELMGIRVEVLPCTTADYPRPASRPPNSILEKRRLLQLGLDLMRDWDEDLEQFVRLHGEALIGELRGAA
jgi:dTDP-4-dehydrorhamnose reductase